MRFAVILIFCVSVYVRLQISPTVTPIGVNFYTMVEISSGQIFSPFSGDIFRGHKIWGQERGSDGPFLVSQTLIFAI